MAAVKILPMKHSRQANPNDKKYLPDQVLSDPTRTFTKVKTE